MLQYFNLIRFQNLTERQSFQKALLIPTEYRNNHIKSNFNTDVTELKDPTQPFILMQDAIWFERTFLNPPMGYSICIMMSLAITVIRHLAARLYLVVVDP